MKSAAKGSFNYAASVILSIFLPVLPQFEEIREVCVHAVHTHPSHHSPSVPAGQLGAWLRITLEFLNIPKSCCQILQSLDS